MSWISPVTNRTQEDVDLVIQYEKIGYDNLTTEQKIVWNAGMIGALNASDLNRIEGNIQYLANLLEIRGLIVKTNWKMNDICRNSDFRRILDNLESIKDEFDLQFEYEVELPDVPDLPLNSYQKINDIENIIYIIHDALERSLLWSNLVTSDIEEFMTSDGENFEVVS